MTRDVNSLNVVIRTVLNIAAISSVIVGDVLIECLNIYVPRATLHNYNGKTMNKKGRIENLKHFSKGDKNINRNGRPKKLPALDTLLAEVFGEDEMQKILKAVYAKALKGDTRAAEIILERGYGKVKQDLGLDGEILLKVTRKVIK